MRRWPLLLLCVAACGNITRKQDDAGVPDDAKVVDASIDAPPPTESREVLTGGEKLTGATYTFDVQVGHPLQQMEITGTTYRLEGNAAVKP